MLKVRYKDIENKVKNMKQLKSLNNQHDEYDEYDDIYKIESKNISKEIINLDSISKIISNKNKCSDCEKKGFNEIKKFKPIDEQLNLEELDDDFGRCTCGKRHIDIVMSHILKIMKEENIEFKRFTLRNGPIPLVTPMFSNKNEPYIEKNSLIILHPKLTKNIAKRIIKEVSEVKGVIKGDPNDTVGLLEVDSDAISYELLAGSDFRCDIVQSPVGEIAINKIQHLSYLEFPPSMENKIKRVWEYIQSKNLSKEEISKMTIIDGTCGNGTLGIFLLKLGVKKVIFNDIWKPATVMTSINIEANGLKGDNFELYNLPLEELGKIIYKERNNKNKNTIRNNNRNNNSNNDSNNDSNKNDNDSNNPNRSNNGNNINKGNNHNNKNDNDDDKGNNDRENENKLDICILDCFPETDDSNLKKIAENLAKDVLII